MESSEASSIDLLTILDELSNNLISTPQLTNLNPLSEVWDTLPPAQETSSAYEGVSQVSVDLEEQILSEYLSPFEYSVLRDYYNIYIESLRCTRLPRIPECDLKRLCQKLNKNPELRVNHKRILNYFKRRLKKDLKAVNPEKITSQSKV